MLADNIRKCNRCGYEWLKRTEGEPKWCPKCISPYWNKERKIIKSQENGDSK